MPVEFERELRGVERRLSGVDEIDGAAERLEEVQRATTELFAVQQAAEAKVVPHREWLVRRVAGLAEECLMAYSSALSELLRPSLLKWRERAKRASQRGVEPGMRRQEIAEINVFLAAVREPLANVGPAERSDLEAIRRDTKAYEEEARRFLREAEPPQLGYLRRVDRSRRR